MPRMVALFMIGSFYAWMAGNGLFYLRFQSLKVPLDPRDGLKNLVELGLDNLGVNEFDRPGHYAALPYASRFSSSLRSITSPLP